ncbi:MAG: hypothetical protein HY695_22615 [Deltaproteobacteria bacterium]|nr:hypothetical protein [Deltaproteobacteria bacterium]
MLTGLNPLNGTVCGQVHGLTVQVSSPHSEIRNRVAEFLKPLLRGEDGGPYAAVDFTLALLDKNRIPAEPAGSKTLIQFANVSCFRNGDHFSFHAKDGSFIEANVQARRGWGFVSKELTGSKWYILADLLMAPLMEMLKQRGFCGLHAAALSNDGKGYLFPGDAESGKTSIALSLIKRGFRYLADDKVLLTQENGELVALAFTRRFNIDPEISRWYPELSCLEKLEPLPFTVKRPIDVSEIYPDSFVSSCSPRFLIYLQRTEDFESRIVPLAPQESFKRLVRQTIYSFERDVVMRQIRLLGQLVKTTKGYLLYHGRDLFGDPERLLELLSCL